MENIPDQGFELAETGKFMHSAIIVSTGIRGDKEDLFVINPELSKQFKDFKENQKILIDFSKQLGKSYTYFQQALVSFEGQKVAVLQRWMKPFTWDGNEISYCSPHVRVEM